MTEITGSVVSVYVGPEGTLEKRARDSIELELDGIVGDRHRGLSRQTWEGDKQIEGTWRRNERMWSAVSVEELAFIEQAMNLAEPLEASSLGANLCLQGIPNLSQLARGTILKFPSGAELMIEEYNPPCTDMGEKLASMHTEKSGEPIADTAFSQAGKFSRGIVGIVEVAGVISVGDVVRVEPEFLPKWLRRLALPSIKS
jgi:MOSC domain-containing protein YiiM